MEAEIIKIIDKIRNVYLAEARGKKKYDRISPATDAQIKSFEKKLGESLPGDYTEFLKNNDLVMGFNYGFRVLSLKEVVSEWNVMKKQLEKGAFDGKVKQYEKVGNGNWDGGYIKKIWWSAKWIPFAKDELGSFKCIDLDPVKKKNRGQVITMATGEAPGPYLTSYESFESYLDEQAYHYEEKAYEVQKTKTGNMVIHIDTFEKDIREKVAVIRDIYSSKAKGGVKYRSIKKAKSEKIKAFEKKAGIHLPEAYVVFLKHNDVAMSFDGGFEAMPLDRVIKTWNMMKTHLDKGTFDDGRVEHHIKEEFGNWKNDYVKKVWWSTKWIPFAEDSCGNTKCIDLDPGKNGEKGQITAMEIQDGQGPFATKYLSFSSYLEDQVDFYKNNQYDMEESWDGSALIRLNSHL